MWHWQCALQAKNAVDEGSLFLQMRKLPTCSPLWVVMARPNCRHNLARPQELHCWSETHSKNFVLLCGGGARLQEKFLTLGHRCTSICRIRTKGRTSADSKRWRGPAVILAADETSRCCNGHRNRTYLVAAESWRYPSAEEAIAAEAVAKTPGEGSKPRHSCNVNEENQTSKGEELEERGAKAELYCQHLNKTKPNFATASEPQASQKKQALQSSTMTSTDQRCDRGSRDSSSGKRKRC